MKQMKVLSGAKQEDVDLRKSFVETYKNSAIYLNEILQNIGLYINRMNLGKRSKLIQNG